jgi:hypothetical protein
MAIIASFNHPLSCPTSVLPPFVEELHLRTWWNLLPVSAHSAITWRHEHVNKLGTRVSVPTNYWAKKLKPVITLLRWPTVTRLRQRLITTSSWTLQNGGLGKSLSRIFQFQPSRQRIFQLQRSRQRIMRLQRFRVPGSTKRFSSLPAYS